MKQDDQKTGRTLWIFITLSILVHLLLAAFFFWLPKTGPLDIPPPPQEQVVWVKPNLLPPANPQLADIQKPAVEKRPDKTRFVGKYDSTVPEEQVAIDHSKPKVINEEASEEKVKPKKSTPQVDKEEKAPPKKEVAEKKPPPEKKIPPKREAPSTPPSLSDLALRPQDVLKKEDMNEAQDTPKTFRNPGSALSVGKPSTPGLFPQDYFPDYKVGGKTYLNVMKLQDIGYFITMKRILKMRWNPVPSVQSYLASNRVSVGKIDCVIGLALDPTGKISELFVIRASGVPGYDQEAMQTIRDSSPFASPPPQFLKEGQLRMSWTFTVYL